MFGEQFYPTPEPLIYKMLEGLDMDYINTVLEPSAGKGDLVKGLISFQKTKRTHYSSNLDIDCIEIDPNLQQILRGTKCRVVHDNFLTYGTFKKYDLIIMNPPFKDGDKHLLKALEMQKNGGMVICLLNVETINNPYSNARQDLLNKLKDYNAEIQSLTGEFEQAERRTSVEIALVKVNIPKKYEDSILLDGLKRAQEVKENGISAREVVTGTVIDQYLEHYQNECQIGTTLINEYHKLRLYQSANEQTYDVIKLTVDGHDSGQLNSYIKKIRHKYWSKLFENKEWREKLTTNLLNELHDKVKELQNYEFSFFNIQRLWLEAISQIGKSLQQTVVDLFDEFSSRHSWAEYSKNVHYYNGWKTNQCWIINKKVIIPLSGYGWSGRYSPSDYRVSRKMMDIEKVFDFLSCRDSDHTSMRYILEAAEKAEQTKKVETKYFFLTFYKKGTCHIEFKDLELLKKFNIFVSQRKDWLPPSYGKKNYQEMNVEEQMVIDSFEGAENYQKVLQDTGYYLVNENDILKLLPVA